MWLCKFSTLLILTVTGVKSQTMGENDAHISEEGFQGLEGSAFLALRSCHQLLRGNRGEFFSPDYLCSSPALWCNWTIQVHEGQRVQLYLEDLTPEHTCHQKMDQIHLDESPVSAGGSRVLERCWRKVRYASVSNTVHVVQLIWPNPIPTHRGFYGQYQAFGPLQSPPNATSAVKVSMEEGDEEVKDTTDRVTEAPEQKRFTTKSTPSVENTDNALAELEDISQVTRSWTNELPASRSWEKVSGEIRKTREGAEKQASTNEGEAGGLTAEENTPLSLGESTFGTHTTPSSTSAPHTLLTEEVSPVFSKSTSMNKKEAGPRSKPGSEETGPAETEMESSPALKDDSGDDLILEMSYNDSGGTFQVDDLEPDGGFGENNVHMNSTRKSKPSHRTKGKSLPVHTIRQPPEPPHLPGGLLLEVTVEVGVNPTHTENWDHIRDSFRNAVENKIQKHLKNLHLKSISSKRSKRLNAGVLLIVWLQFAESDEERLGHGSVQFSLQQLKGKTIKPQGIKSHGIIASISVEDINECDTQMVMCDVHAECVNEFGSYSCHCRHGYSAGLGGAVCVEAKGEDSHRTSLPMLLYVVCVLVCLFMALLVVVVCVFYRRYHTGVFLPSCHNSSSTSFSTNNDKNSSKGCVNTGVNTSSRPPPPPAPPLRLPKGSTTALDLPLLKFTPLVPTEILEGTVQRQKEQL
ncbi:uncharacterized protein zgc:66455 isoform X3 [Hoplias malabaricus]|uniref:uncharacterized protein zgc:66455 isoform X3 n=1 Tax=Hoplias malabaricus TaxID=27720 RepID=UPI003461B02C